MLHGSLHCGLAAFGRDDTVCVSGIASRYVISTARPEGSTFVISSEGAQHRSREILLVPLRSLDYARDDMLRDDALYVYHVFSVFNVLLCFSVLLCFYVLVFY